VASPSARGRRVRKPGIGERLRANFLTGLAVVLPAGLTLMLLHWALGFVDDKVAPLLPAWLGERVFGLGFVVFLAATAAVGAAIKGYAGRNALRLGEGMLGRVPVVRSIYAGAKQMVEALIAKGQTSFRQPCLIEFPRWGLWTLAFIAGPGEGELPARAGEQDLVAVFLATAPNPITGLLYFAPRRDVILLDMSAEDGLKLVLSAGVAEPRAAPASAPA
jgi:uncharacterized membrane protein